MKEVLFSFKKRVSPYLHSKSVAILDRSLIHLNSVERFLHLGTLAHGPTINVQEPLLAQEHSIENLRVDRTQ